MRCGILLRRDAEVSSGAHQVVAQPEAARPSHARQQPTVEGCLCGGRLSQR